MPELRHTQARTAVEQLRAGVRVEQADFRHTVVVGDREGPPEQRRVETRHSHSILDQDFIRRGFRLAGARCLPARSSQGGGSTQREQLGERDLEFRGRGPKG